MTDAWILEDSSLTHQVQTTIEPKIHDLVFHCVTVKELWYFLHELYKGSSNINRAYDAIQKLFQKKQNGKPIDDHNGEFNHLAKELHQIFLITSDVKYIQRQWNRLMILTTWVPSTLFILRLSLKLWEAPLWAVYRRHHFLKNVIHVVSSDTTTVGSNWSALTTQERDREMRRPYWWSWRRLC